MITYYPFSALYFIIGVWGKGAGHIFFFFNSYITIPWESFLDRMERAAYQKNILDFEQVADWVRLWVDFLGIRMSMISIGKEEKIW